MMFQLVIMWLLCKLQLEHIRHKWQQAMCFADAQIFGSDKGFYFIQLVLNLRLREIPMALIISYAINLATNKIYKHVRKRNKVISSALLYRYYVQQQEQLTIIQDCIVTCKFICVNITNIFLKMNMNGVVLVYFHLAKIFKENYRTQLTLKIQRSDNDALWRNVQIKISKKVEHFQSVNELDSNLNHCFQAQSFQLAIVLNLVKFQAQFLCDKKWQACIGIPMVDEGRKPTIIYKVLKYVCLIYLFLRNDDLKQKKLEVLVLTIFIQTCSDEIVLFASKTAKF